MNFFFVAVVNCGTLNAPANGQVSHTAGTTFGQTATYSCNTGYNLMGNSTRTCQANGVWSGSEPTCRYVGASLIYSLLYLYSFIIIKCTFRAT